MMITQCYSENSAWTKLFELYEFRPTDYEIDTKNILLRHDFPMWVSVILASENSPNFFWIKGDYKPILVVHLIKTYHKM